jgi:4-diphosphocytidyl-2-C-methyl-D-erythritol kinase
MLDERRDDTVVVRAPAKVNLYLEVLAKRPDGYHEIQTLMVAVGLYDTLEFKEDASGAIRLACDIPELSTGPDNLIVRAANLLRERTGCKRGSAIRLWKRIPMAAGLAGGSTDCAATLAGLNRLWRLGLSREELAKLSGELGSDVPFFFATPAAWCTGRGEVVTPMKLGRPLDLVIVKPAVGLSTAEVYRGVTIPAESQTGDEIRGAVERGDLVEIGSRLHNRLQEVAERVRPEIAAGLAQLEALRPIGVLMSGSGTSLFALCRDTDDAQRIARRLQNENETASGTVAGGNWQIHVVRSCS